MEFPTTIIFKTCSKSVRFDGNVSVEKLFLMNTLRSAMRNPILITLGASTVHRLLTNKQTNKKHKPSMLCARA